jgi:hypothetical protein
MGNHDFFKQPVFDDFIDKDGIITTTLWTNFDNNPMIEMDAQRGIWDFKYIPGFTTTICKFLHEQQKKAIFESNSDVVVTHFGPSHFSISDVYKGDPLSSYFCNEMTDKIMMSTKKAVDSRSRPRQI